MNMWAVALMATLTGCASLDRALVGIAGAWRADDGRKVTLAPNGLYQTATSSGCWEEEGSTIRLTHPCVARSGFHLTVSDATVICRFSKTIAVPTQAEILTLDDCPDAGAYRRVSTWRRERD